MENLNRIRSIKTKLESIKETQPNLYNLWKITIYKQEAGFVKTLLECEHMLDKVETLNKPLSIMDIQTLFILGSTIRKNY
jgi:hypothetical protein